jgi:UDP-N-acetylmuramate: L-alanyl-gamma-D-glutamyl-meso-diaminopimelate ligase
MVAWLLQHAGLEPGFLIGGVPRNFEESARLGHHPFFVVEADEYDTAFFDKRSKFVHYRPRTLVLNNLEYDHADIFPDLASIERQFHHLVRIVPASGLILVNGADGNLARVLDMGCWTPVQRFGFTADDDWQAVPSGADGGRFQVFHPRQVPGESGTGMPGRHNISNGVAAIAAAVHCGVPPTMAVEGLSGFAGVRRRMELRGEVSGIRVFDDFAHHPTAISTTLEGARRQAPGRRIVAVLEPRSNTMRAGIHRETLGPSLAGADTVFIFRPPGLQWDLDSMAASHHSASVFDAVEDLVGAVVDQARVGDDIVVMSNGGFGGIHEQLLGRLASDMPNRDSSLSEPAGRRK